MPKGNIDEQRELIVAKSNDLIQKVRYSLPIQQQKLLLYLISKIKPNDRGDEEYTFSIREFCEIIGADPDSGFYYQEVKRSIKKLRDSSAWILKPDGEEELFSWLNTAKMHRGSGTISIRFSESCQPYLFMLQERFYMFRIQEILPFKSKYSIKLFELLESHSWRGREVDEDGLHHSRRDLVRDVVVNYEVEKLKVLIDATKYTRTVDVIRRAIDPAVQEINFYSDDIHVEYDLIRDGRTIREIEFTLSAPRAKHILQARNNRQEKLDRNKES